MKINDLQLFYNLEGLRSSVWISSSVIAQPMQGSVTDKVDLRSEGLSEKNWLAPAEDLLPFGNALFNKNFVNVLN